MTIRDAVSVLMHLKAELMSSPRVGCGDYATAIDKVQEYVDKREPLIDIPKEIVDPKDRFAEIEFVPICTRCKRPLNGSVIFTQGRDRIEGHKYQFANYSIDPDCCPDCGARFTTIVVNNPKIVKEGENWEG